MSFLKRRRSSDSSDTVIYDEDDSWQYEDEEETLENLHIVPPTMKDMEKQPSAYAADPSSSFEHRAHIWDLEATSGKLRFKIHRVVDHVFVRLLSMVLVLIDIILVIVSVSLTGKSDEQEEAFVIVAIIFSCYFMIELMLRMYSWGCEFFHHRVEVIDMVIIIVSFILTIVLAIAIQDKDLKFGQLVVALRLLRLLRIFRMWTGRKHVERSTRNLISQNKRRYVKDGFDLDLTFVTDRVIAMSFPSSGTTSMYRNPISEVARFFNTKYPGHYKIYNLCSERKYETHWFNDSVERVLIDDHNVPTMRQLLDYCHSANEWMKKDKGNILALHCKGGKGRTGTAVAAWLLYSNQFRNADKALNYFGTRRTDEAKGAKYQGVETPSQSRYVWYLEKVLTEYDGKLPEPVDLTVSSIKINGIRSVGNGDGSDLSLEIVMNGNIVYEFKFNELDKNHVTKSHDKVIVKFDPEKKITVCGDVKFRFISTNSSVPKDYDDCAFFFWFHTSFVENKVFLLSRNDIGNCHKKKHRKTYKENFSVTVKFQ